MEAPRKKPMTPGDTELDQAGRAFETARRRGPVLYFVLFIWRPRFQNNKPKLCHHHHQNHNTTGRLSLTTKKNEQAVAAKARHHPSVSQKKKWPFRRHAVTILDTNSNIILLYHHP
jgi:hypothetical protein